MQLPINRPLNPVANYQREGRGVFVSQGSAPNYFPNSFGGPVESVRAQDLEPSFKLCGDVKRYENKDVDNISQPKDYWNNVFDNEHKSRVITNMAASLKTVRSSIQKRTIALFSHVSKEISERLEKALERDT